MLPRLCLGRFLSQIPSGEDAVLQLQEAIGNAEDPQIMCDQDQGAILFASQALQKSHDFLPGRGIERSRRFIRQTSSYTARRGRGRLASTPQTT
jgi:hypothetical protein